MLFCGSYLFAQNTAKSHNPLNWPLFLITHDDEDGPAPDPPPNLPTCTHCNAHFGVTSSETDGSWLALSNEEQELCTWTRQLQQLVLAVVVHIKMLTKHFEFIFKNIFELHVFLY